MLARFAVFVIFLAALCAGPGFARQDTQSKDLIQTRSAEPTGKGLYTSSHALIIGVNDYPNLPKDRQLRFAVSDANAMRDMLVNSYGFAADQVTVLTNEKASLANIRLALSDLSDPSKVKPDDRVLIYFSGHGQTVKLPTGGEMGFLIPSDAKIDLNKPTDAAQYMATCLPMKQVWDYLEMCPAKHACIIADACFSGALARSRGIAMTSETVAAMLARPARQVLTAGSAGQETYEKPDLGHGAFTYKLLEELKARAADPGKVFKLLDLYMALQDSVSNLTDGKELPQFGNDETEGQVLFCSGTALSAGSDDATSGGGTGGAGGDTKPPKTTRASLTLTSTPPGAKLILDGVNKGTTPVSVQYDLKGAPQLDVKVRLEAKGYIPSETTVTLKPGDDLTVPIDLKPVPVAPPPVTTASIQIESDPAGADVIVDGKKLGVTPYALSVDLKNTTKQTFKIRVELAGYVAAETSSTVQRGDTISVPFHLNPVPVKPTEPGKEDRHVAVLKLKQTASLAGEIPVNSILFSPDSKQLAVSGLDYSLTLYSAGGGKPKKVDAPQNTIVRMTPDWTKMLFIRILTDGQNTWAQILVKDAKDQKDINGFKVPLRPGIALNDVYVGNDRVVLCGSFGEGERRTGSCTVADIGKGSMATFSGGYRITNPTGSADGKTFAVYMEPTDLRSSGQIAIIPADLSQKSSLIPTQGCTTCGGLKLSDDGSRVAITCLKVTESGSDVTGTQIYEVASGSLVQTLPKIRVAALVENGAKLLGWRTQIGGPIVELLDAKTGNGLGQAPGGEMWLSQDATLAAQASPEGSITVYRLGG